MKILKRGVAGFLSLAIVAGFSASAFASDLGNILGGVAVVGALGNLSSVSTRTDTLENLQKTVNYYVSIQEKDRRTSFEGQTIRETRTTLRNEYKHLPTRIQNLGMFLKDVREFAGDGKYCYITLSDIEIICNAAEYALRGYIPSLYTDAKGVVRDKNNNDEAYDVNSLEFRDSFVNPENVAKIKRISIFPYDCVTYGYMDSLDGAKIAVCLQKLQAAGRIDKSTVEPFLNFCERRSGSDILKRAEEALKNPQQ